MLWFLANNAGPIGLDIGHNSIKMIQLGGHGERLSVIAADRVEFDRSITANAEQRRSFAVSAVKEMLNRCSFHGRNVISCLSGDELKIKSLRIDAEVDEKTPAILEDEIASRSGINANTETINYMVAGKVRQGDETKTELILFTADKEVINTHIEFLEEAGLRPVAIDIVPCALFRNFERFLRRQRDSEAVNVFVDLGSRFTTVVISRGRDISFVKQIPIGRTSFNIGISRKLDIGIDKAVALREQLTKARRQSNIDAQTRRMVVDSMQEAIEELAKEISLCFRYYAVTFRGKRPRRAIFTGGQAYEQGLVDAMRQRLGVEIEIAEPLRHFDLKNVNFGSERRSALCEWAVAVGLSLKGSDAVISGRN